MLKNEIDVLVVAHNICVAFGWIDERKQRTILWTLREIEKDAVRLAREEKNEHNNS